MKKTIILILLILISGCKQDKCDYNAIQQLINNQYDLQEKHNLTFNLYDENGKLITSNTKEVSLTNFNHTYPFIYSQNTNYLRIGIDGWTLPQKLRIKSTYKVEVEPVPLE